MAIPSENLAPSNTLVPGDNDTTETSVNMATRKHVMVHYRPGESITAKAGEKIQAGTFVSFTGEWDDRRNPTVVAAKAGVIPAGFIRRDVDPGSFGDEYIAVDRSNFIVDLRADDALTAGDAVAVGDGGIAVKAADNAATVGFAVSTAVDGYAAIAVR